MICPGCKLVVRFWQKILCPGNSSWHYSCMITNDNAHTIANKWSERECNAVGLPGPLELYRTKGSIGERDENRMNKLLQKYKLKEWWERTKIV